MASAKRVRSGQGSAWEDYQPQAVAPLRLIIKVTGDFKQRYGFSWFCDEVLPFTQAQIRDFQAAKARKGERSTHKQYGSIYQRWYLVCQDLLRIQNHFWFGGMQEPGHRDHMLFHTANALSWFTCSDALANEIKATARILVPSYCTDEVMSYCSSVIDRARRTQQTEGSEFRYKYARKTLWAAFEPIVGQEPETRRARIRQPTRPVLHAVHRRQRQRQEALITRSLSGFVSRVISQRTLIKSHLTENIWKVGSPLKFMVS